VPEEADETRLLVLSLLLRRAGWSVVPVGQRAPDEKLDEVIASVQPHAVLFSATRKETAAPLLSLAADLREEHPDLLLVFSGEGFRLADVAALGGSSLLVSSDARQALEEIERRMPAPAQGPGIDQAA
jgi:hypothetical protein